MKKYIKYYLVLIVLFVLAVYFQYNAPKPINWAENYTKKDKIPYGCFVLHQLLPELFPNQKILHVNEPIYTALDSLNNFNYLFINNEFSPDEAETEKLLNAIYKGNTAFIAAREFYGHFADTFNIATDGNYNFYYNEKNNSPIHINFENKNIRQDSPYIFHKNIFHFYLTNFDTANTTVLGHSEIYNLGNVDYQQKVNFIAIKHGKGKIYINTLPAAFTNYFLTDSLNYSYAFNALSYLDKNTLIWDDYYKIGKPIITSPLRFILSNPALKFAYFLAIFSLLIYIVFNIKRRQRIIPVIEPLSNATTDFVEVVSQMYYHQKNHLDLANKKIIYFLENVRTNYLLNTQQLDNDFKKQLARKSGVEMKFAEQLINELNTISTKKSLSETELLHLNQLINTFHKNKIR